MLTNSAIYTMKITENANLFSYYIEQIRHCKGWHDHNTISYYDVIKWKHFPRYWPFVRGIHRPPVNSPHKGQWRGALISSLICVWINGWVHNPEAGDLRRSRAYYDVSVIDFRIMELPYKLCLFHSWIFIQFQVAEYVKRNTEKTA